MNPGSWMQYSLAGNALSRWMLALGIFFGVLLLVTCLLWLIRSYLRKLSERTELVLDDLVVAVLSKTKKSLLALIALRAALTVLDIPDDLSLVAGRAAIVALLLQVGIWASTGLNAWVASYRAKRAGEEEVATWLGGFSWAGRVVIWTMVLLVCLENLGIDITGLVTGLGIGGIAVALAVQNILGDLFASFSIYFDRPFVIGDSLAVGSDPGKVESIGLKTTRLRSPSGEELIIANSDLLKSRIKNYGRMEERRVIFELGLTYDTPAAKVEALPEMLREIIESQPDTRFARSHFKELGESSLVLETVYYMKIADYLAYLDVLQAVNLAVLRLFEEQGIELAFPTQTVLLQERDADSR